MKSSLFFLVLLLSACAGSPKAAVPQTAPKPSYGVVAPTTDPRILEIERAAALQSTLSVDPTALFFMEATDDAMVMRLSASIDAFLGGERGSVRFEGDEGLVTMEITARPSSEVVNPSVSAGTLRMAYATPGWTVSSMWREQRGAWGRFTYSGTRADCDGSEERCTKTRPVQGMVLVMRLPEQPEYTVIVRAEWHPALRTVVEPSVTAVIDSIRVEQR